MHKTTSTDDKRLQNTLKRLGVNTIPGIEEVLLLNSDGTALQVRASAAGAAAWERACAAHLCGRACVSGLLQAWRARAGPACVSVGPLVGPTGCSGRPPGTAMDAYSLAGGRSGSARSLLRQLGGGWAEEPQGDAAGQLRAGLAAG